MLLSPTTKTGVLTLQLCQWSARCELGQHRCLLQGCSRCSSAGTSGPCQEGSGKQPGMGTMSPAWAGDGPTQQHYTPKPPKSTPLGNCSLDTVKPSRASAALLAGSLLATSHGARHACTEKPAHHGSSFMLVCNLPALAVPVSLQQRPTRSSTTTALHSEAAGGQGPPMARGYVPALCQHTNPMLTQQCGCRGGRASQSHGPFWRQQPPGDSVAGARKAAPGCWILQVGATGSARG